MLNTIQPNRINLGGSFNFTGTLTKSGVNIATVDDLATGSSTIANKTLTNTNTVTLLDSLFTLQDNGDITRQLQFQLSGITAGNTRILSVPDYDGTVATLAGLETLTQKTLTSPKINLGSDANYDLYYRSAGNLVRLPVGSNNQRLSVVNGVLAWQDLIPLTIPVAGLNRAGASPDINCWSFWAAFTNNDANFISRDMTTTTTLNVRGVAGTISLINANTNVSGLAAAANVGCRVVDGGVDKLIWANDAAATLYIANADGTGVATASFSGTAPASIVRVGYDKVNNHVWIADGANKAATNVKRYTLSAGVLTNINSDITLSVAPANAGQGTIFIGRTYALICDTVGTATSQTIQRFNKTTGAKVDTITILTPGSATVALAALAWSVRYERLYMFRYYSSLATVNSGAFELLDID